jgi:hypothetical protein
VPVATDAYDPHVYRDVYARLLRYRTVDVISIDVVLPTSAMSVYDFAVPSSDLVPDAAEADRLVQEMERRHPDLVSLAREADAWWKI